MTKSKRFLDSFSVIGIPPVLFAVIAAVVLAASFVTIGPNHKILLPGGLIGAFAASIVIGGILATIGEETPILNNYMGGGAFAVLFGSSALVYFHIMPAPTVALMKGFIKGGGFLNFYIAALIAGSILGMNKKLLIAASANALPARSSSGEGHRRVPVLRSGWNPPRVRLEGSDPLGSRCRSWAAAWAHGAIPMIADVRAPGDRQRNARALRCRSWCPP